MLSNCRRIIPRCGAHSDFWLPELAIPESPVTGTRMFGRETWLRPIRTPPNSSLAYDRLIFRKEVAVNY
jgi:hypothetical protein